MYSFLFLHRDKMSYDIFYLIPARGCKIAESALTLKQNASSVITLPINNGDTQDHEVLCFVVRIRSQARQDWEFTIGSQEDSDTFLPCKRNQEIKCAIWLCGRSNDFSNAALMIPDHSTVATKVLDPINQNERVNDVADVFTNGTRFLEHPHMLCIGEYHFDVKHPQSRSKKDVAQLEARKREVMTEFPQDAVEVWRDTGEYLGGGAFGQVYRVRGMRTGAEAARKRMVGSWAKIREIKAELEMIQSLDHVSTALVAPHSIH